MNLFRIFILVLIGSLALGANNANACDDYQENGGAIFLRTTFITYSDEYKIFNVEIRRDDFIRLQVNSTNCGVTVMTKYPFLKVKLYRASSKVFVGFEPRYSRFVKLTSD